MVTRTHLVRCLWIVGILVGMVFQGQLPVRLLDLIGGGRLWQTQQLVERVAGRPAGIEWGEYIVVNLLLCNVWRWMWICR